MEKVKKCRLETQRMMQEAGSMAHKDHVARLSEINRMKDEQSKEM